MEINAVKDPWLEGKDDYHDRVKQDHDYGLDNITVSNFFMMGSRSWDAKVNAIF